MFKSKATWKGQNPHDTLTVDGAVDQSSAVLWHEPYRSYQEHIQTIERYADIASQSLKPSFWRLLVRPPAHFLRAYVLRMGFLGEMVQLGSLRKPWQLLCVVEILAGIALMTLNVLVRTLGTHGGTERFTHGFARWAVEKGHSVSVHSVWVEHGIEGVEHEAIL